MSPIHRCLLPMALSVLSVWLGLREVHAEDQAASTFEFRKGDRVVFVGNTFADLSRRHAYVETLLTIRHARHELRFRNLGWSGDTLRLRPRPLNFGSLDEHLTRLEADVVIACFGMNESFDGHGGLERFEKDWLDFIHHLRSRTYNGKSPPRLVMISPIAHEYVGEPFPDPATHNKSLASYTKRMGQIAQQQRVPFVDLFTATAKLSAERPSQKLTSNGIHLNAYGYWAVSHAIADALSSGGAPWHVEIDAEDASITKATGTKVADVTPSGGGLQFDVSDARLPIPPAPKDAIVHPSLVDRQAVLIVKGLRPGQFTLKLNGSQVAKADHTTWAVGVTIASSPAHRRSEELRRAIIAKNELFFHRWRAHNSEYIVGRRTKPFGSVSFPPEMKKLDEMISQRQHAVWPLAEPLKRQTWKLLPVEEQ